MMPLAHINRYDTLPMRRLVLVVTTMVALGLVPAASANSIRGVAAVLVSKHMRPVPLFPHYFDARFAGSDAFVATSHHGKYFTVTIEQGDINSPDGLQQLVQLHRGAYHDLASLVHFAHVQTHSVVKNRIGRRTVFYAATDVTFWYAWHEQGFTYVYGSHYFGASPRDLRDLVKQTAPLRSADDVNVA